MQLLLDTHGLVVKVRNRSFHIVGKEAKREIGPERITSIAVTADCLFSTAALRLAVSHEIPVYLIGPTGRIEGKLWSPHFVGLASLRRAQALWLELGASQPWLLRLAGQKTRRQLALLESAEAPENAISALLQTIARLDENATETIDTEVLRQTILGLEGTAARSYWQALSDAVPNEWRFDGRSRRPAKDPFNAALNYLYGMMYPAVEAAIFAVGLDPYMGILHAEEYDRPALAFDLIEPFRPWVDELLLDLAAGNALDIGYFEPRDGGWWAGKSARAVLIPRFNDFLLEKRADEHGTLATVRDHLMAFAGTLADDIRGWYAARK